MADDSATIQLVLADRGISKLARASGRVDDFEALREFLAADFVIKAASPWTDEPWQVMHRGADARDHEVAGADQQGHVAHHRERHRAAGRRRRVRRAAVDDRRRATAPTSAWCATSSRWSTASSPACGATATSAGSPLADSPAIRSCRDPVPMSR